MAYGSGCQPLPGGGSAGEVKFHRDCFVIHNATESAQLAEHRAQHTESDSLPSLKPHEKRPELSVVLVWKE